MLTNTKSPAVKYLRYAHYFTEAFLICFIVFIVTNTFAFTTYTVHGHSMDPTLHDGEILGVNILGMTLANPANNDIVILYYAGDKSIHFVKRIVGVPGDTVTYQGNSVVLGPDEYFVEGDNHEHSTDSRVYGPIRRKQIIGTVAWPRK
jgi:signal peptidase I